MKNEPKIIYLNTGEEDVDKGTDFNELVGVSWCEDRIGKYDLKYYNEQVVKDLRKQVRELQSKLDTCRNNAGKRYFI